MIYLFDQGAPETWPRWYYWTLDAWLDFSQYLFGFSWAFEHDGLCLYAGPLKVSLYRNLYDRPNDQAGGEGGWTRSRR